MVSGLSCHLTSQTSWVPTRGQSACTVMTRHSRDQTHSCECLVASGRYGCSSSHVSCCMLVYGVVLVKCTAGRHSSVYFKQDLSGAWLFLTHAVCSVMCCRYADPGSSTCWRVVYLPKGDGGGSGLSGGWRGFAIDMVRHGSSCCAAMVTRTCSHLGVDMLIACVLVSAVCTGLKCQHRGMLS